MLSSALAQGKTPDQLAPVGAAQQADKLGFRLLDHARVTSIDPESHRVLTDRDELRYHQLVLALGAQPIRPPMAGDATEAVLSVNNLDDYRRFRRQLGDDMRVAVIGPGLIGCEFANDLIGAGHRVTLIGPDPHPISTLLPPAAGEALQQAMVAAGADWRLGHTVRRADRQAGGVRLTLSDDSRVDADLVLSAVGLRPDTMLAAQAGLQTARGIVTDRELRTSDPDIYAIGDCAEVAGLNLPYVQPIMHGARALAATLNGTPTAVRYPAMPVTVKTPLHPVVVAPAPRDVDGQWQERPLDGGIEALWQAADGRLLGFALTGGAVAQAQARSRELPPLLI